MIYIWDAYCGWCYGFSKALHSFCENHPELPIQIYSGGLFVGERSLPISEYPHIPEANKRIGQMTGVEFGPSYEELLLDGSFILSSEAASVGFVALRSLAPDHVLDLAAAMQRAFYFEGKSLNDPRTYQEIGVSYGIEENKVLERIEAAETAIEARGDFSTVSKLGVRSYPTLFLRKGNELYNLGEGAMTSEKLEGKFEALMKP